MRSRKLRDAVHGDVHLTAGEFAALDAPEMQRLRGIKQLGAAFYVYPGAQHTRFEHGLGACWMARRIIGAIEADGSFRFDDAEKDAVCLAALVHDVTHIPFGHTFEDERRLLDRHDRSASRYELLLAGGELGERLRADEPGRIALDILAPEPGLPEGRRYLRDLVCGAICADLLDYLKRDNYFCGLRHEYDERIFEYFRVVDGRLALDLHRGGLLRRDALSEITNLLRIRYVLSERVYYHHAKMAAGVMISKAVERALQAGLTECELCEMTDGSLLYALRERFAGDARLLRLVDDFLGRRLFKRCYMLSRRVGEGAVAEVARRYHANEGGARDAAELAVADGLGTDASRVAVYCAPPDMALKEADVPVTMPRGGSALLSALNSDEIRLLQQQHRALWKLYVFVGGELAGRAAEAARLCEQVIGEANELPAEQRGSLG